MNANFPWGLQLALAALAGLALGLLAMWLLLRDEGEHLQGVLDVYFKGAQVAVVDA